MLLKKLQWAYEHVIKTRLLLLFFLLIYFGIMTVSYKDFGLTMDEFFVYTRGRYFYNKVVGNDAHLQKGFVLFEGNNEDILYNNSSYPALLYALNDSESYEGYHFYNILLAVPLFILTYELFLALYKKPHLALIGPLMLFLTPRFTGHIPSNPKDVPFAVWYIISLLSMLPSKWNEKLKLLILGILIGVATSIRFVGFTLIPIYLLYQCILQLPSKYTHPLLQTCLNIFLQATIISFIAFLIFLINMPYVAADPFNHLIELIRMTKEYPWYGDILLFGQSYAFNDRPWWYLFIWILITTPLVILGMAGYALWTRLTNKKNELKLLILISLILQVVLYLILKPVVYNGLRHYLFLVVHIALLATIGCIELLTNDKTRRIAQIALVGLIVAVGYSYLMLHPYQYVYFNSLSGGIKGAKSDFELDYWAASDKEAMTWLSNYLIDQKETDVAVFSCSKSDSLHAYMPQVQDVNTQMERADYIICYNQPELQEIKKRIDGDVIFTVERMGRVYNTIYKPSR